MQERHRRKLFILMSEMERQAILCRNAILPPLSLKQVSHIRECLERDLLGPKTSPKPKRRLAMRLPLYFIDDD